MKTTRNFLSALVVASAPALALFVLGDRLPSGSVVGAFVAALLVAFAVLDYSRQPKSLSLSRGARVVRPTLPQPSAFTPSARIRQSVRTAA